MVKLAEAYFNGKKVKPIWSKGKFSFEDKNTKFAFTESAKKQLFWDMGGIIKNRPSIYTLPSNPENEIFVDSGLIWGEDIIDLILADIGKVILPWYVAPPFFNNPICISVNAAVDSNPLISKEYSPSFPGKPST